MTSVHAEILGYLDIFANMMNNYALNITFSMNKTPIKNKITQSNFNIFGIKINTGFTNLYKLKL